MKPLTIGSLFSGIGGLELGLERAGLGPVLWQVEREPFCRQVLARHWPQAERFDDVRAVGASVLRPVDVICGGFPCQPVSVAGKGKAQADDRWLWPEFARIVGEVRPRFVVCENVPGLVRRGLADVVAGLDGLGYAVVGTRLSAADVGAPHKRERVFLVAYPKRESLRLEQGRGSGQGGERAAIVADNGRSRDLADANGDGLEGLEEDRAAEGPTLGGARGGPGVGALPVLRGGVRVQRPRRTREPLSLRAAGHVDQDALPAHAWTAEPSVGRVAPRLPGDVARLRALGNAVVPQVAEVVGRLVMQLAQGAK